MEDSTNNIIKITTENIKLDSCLKLAGIVSTGGEAKEIMVGLMPKSAIISNIEKLL